MNSISGAVNPRELNFDFTSSNSMKRDQQEKQPLQNKVDHIQNKAISQFKVSDSDKSSKLSEFQIKNQGQTTQEGKLAELEDLEPVFESVQFNDDAESEHFKQAHESKQFFNTTSELIQKSSQEISRSDKEEQSDQSHHRRVIIINSINHVDTLEIQEIEESRRVAQKNKKLLVALQKSKN